MYSLHLCGPTPFPTPCLVKAGVGGVWDNDTAFSVWHNSCVCPSCHPNRLSIIPFKLCFRRTDVNLLARSRYFRALLEGGFEESGSDEVHVKGVCVPFCT